MRVRWWGLPTNGTRFISHRARGFGYPEATTRAIRAALQSDMAGLILDCRLTKDRRWVIPHTTTPEAILRIHSRRLSQLREVIPLDEVIALFAAFGKEKTLYLDVRDRGEEQQLADVVGDRIVICAWHAETLERVHECAPETKLGLNIPPGRTEQTRIDMILPRVGVQLIYHPREHYDAWLGIKPSQRELPDLPLLPLAYILAPSLLCTSELLRRARAKKATVIAFTVNRKISLALLERQGVQNVITDEP